MKKRVFTLSLLILSVLIVTGCALLQRQQQELSGKLIRLHVVANSDSEADQARKLRVRDAVLAVTQKALADTADPWDTLAVQLPAIQAAAEEASGGEQVAVTLQKELFPTRQYESFSLPAGVYRSLRVNIGAADGHNWWCVVFPSICLSASMDDLEQAAEVAGFSDAEIKLITEADEGYVLKFKSIELLQKLKNFLLDA